MKPNVLVLMATYNGEAYVEQQIESILAQEGVLVTLVICDDGSSDSTCAICRKLDESHANVTFKQNPSNKGVSRNFMDMIYEAESAKYDYFALSDQDDYWLPEKLSKGIELLSAYSDEPALYYSDVCNVDENLAGPETYDYRAFQKCQDSLATLLVTNWACGCTMVFNQKLCAMLQTRRPREMHRIHDVWIHLVALACGRCVPDLGRSFLKRRITGKNVSGEYQLGTYDRRRLLGMIRYLSTPTDHYATLMAEELLSCWGDSMTADDARFTATFARMRTSLACRLKMVWSTRFKMLNKRESLILRVRILLNML